jgi:Cu-Zn family superoxide dismutase
MIAQRWRLVTIAVLMGAGGAAAWWTPLGAQPPGGTGRGGGGGRGGQGRGSASALAVFEAAPNGPKVEGTVLFFAHGGGSVQVVADVSGMPKAGLYALHVHEKGECKAGTAGPAFTSAGGDFNPTGVAHGCPQGRTRHAGDLGNVEVDAEGNGHLELTVSTLSLAGANSLVDKAVILHSATDDCATQPDGNAGSRLACGVALSVDDTPSRPPRRQSRTPPGSGPP